MSSAPANFLLLSLLAVALIPTNNAHFYSSSSSSPASPPSCPRPSGGGGSSQEKLPDRQFFVIGHAGGDPASYCENTAAATRSALAFGANAVEIDLSLSLDGVIFLWHDPEPLSVVTIVRRSEIFLCFSLLFI